MTDRSETVRAALGSLASTLRSGAATVPGCDPALAARIVRAAEAAVEMLAVESPRDPAASVERQLAASGERPEAAPLVSPTPEPQAAERGDGPNSKAAARRLVRGAADRPADPADLPWVPAKGVAPAKGVGSDELLAIRSDLGECERCGLCARRTNIVFGVGNPNARLLFIGEAPGADEDRQGEPFVGKAGQLLSKMIGAMGLSRSDVYIANVVKCRPPGNRDPQPHEVAACRPFLDQQIAAIKPEAIVTLGRVAAVTLLDRNVAIKRERGSWTSYRDVPVLLTLHPAYLLRQPNAKRDAWADLQKVMQRLGLERPGRS